MSYKIVSLKCDVSKNDWVLSASAEAAVLEEGEEKPIYLEAAWTEDSKDQILCEQNNRSVHSLVTYEKEGDLDARRKGGRIFREYDRACKSEYGEVFPVLKDLLRTFLHLNGVDALDPKAEAKK